MTRKRIAIGLIGLLVIAVAVVFLDPTRSILGMIRGEPFLEGRPASYWSTSLSGNDPDRRAVAIRTLKDAKADAIPVLLESLRDSSNSRTESLFLLGQLGETAKAATPTLIPFLTNADPHVRFLTAKTINAIGEAPPEAMPIFVSMLDGPERLIASRALSRYKGEARGAIPALRKLLKDPDIDVRWNAARTLGKIGPDSKHVVPDLIAECRDGQSVIREHAAEALGDIGPEAKDGVPILIELLTDEDDKVRRDSARSLGQIGPASKPAIPKLLIVCKDKVPMVREAAIKAVRLIDPTIELEIKK